MNIKQQIADLNFRGKREFLVCCVIRRSMTKTTRLPNLQGLHMIHEQAVCVLRLFHILGHLVLLNFQNVYLKQRNRYPGVTMN